VDVAEGRAGLLQLAAGSGTAGAGGRGHCSTSALRPKRPARGGAVDTARRPPFVSAHGRELAFPPSLLREMDLILIGGP
jgi:hypothetical protein